jgi:hypothetical protein
MTARAPSFGDCLACPNILGESVKLAQWQHKHHDNGGAGESDNRHGADFLWQADKSGSY